MPWMPLANSTISPAWTLSSPWMRAMPSPTDSTWPTSETCASVPKLAIWSLMTLEISAARISIVQPFIACAREFKRVLIELIDHLAADLDDQAAEDARDRR